MTISEIQSKIDDLKENVKNKRTYIEQYRNKRAALVVNKADTAGNRQAIAGVDKQIEKLQKAVDNAPAELSVLEQNLNAEKQRVAEAERAALLDSQQKAAAEVENLSAEFIEVLEKANEINAQLRATLSAESGIRQKTGKQLLGSWCHGSIQSLKALLEKSQREMSGVHTVPTGPGIVASGTPIQL